MKVALAFALILALCAPAAAQAPGGVATPFGFTPLALGQHNLTPTSATPLSVPANALYAVVCAASASVRYTTDGATTPTASLGMTLAAGACVFLSGAKVLANFSAISASGTLDAEFFR